MKSEVLPAIVRVKILEGRLKALDAGSGDFAPDERKEATIDCLAALIDASVECGAGRA